MYTLSCCVLSRCLLVKNLNLENPPEDGRIRFLAHGHHDALDHLRSLVIIKSEFFFLH